MAFAYQPVRAAMLSSMRRPLSLCRLPPRYQVLPTSRHASTKAQTDKSRILEKPERFNPPSHGSRRVKPRMYPGPRLSEQEKEEQSHKRYPNTMPPEGTLTHTLLTSRGLHLTITLVSLYDLSENHIIDKKQLVLTSLTLYSLSLSFHNSTAFRSELPSSSDWLSHPFQSLSQFISVYKLHVAYESEKVAEKRRKKIEDADKRKEFLRAHGVEPGFLTGSWMEKFGTVEGDQAREALEKRLAEEREKEEKDADLASPVARAENQEMQQKDKPKRKVWLGIW